MKVCSLETLIASWQVATEEQRQAAITALKGMAGKTAKTPTVIRWIDLAERLQVTKRTARTATQRAGVIPVRLPGRDRSIGIKTADVWKLEGGTAL